MPEVGELAQWACVAEVTAPKPGNVSVHASFDDLTWKDFIVSAMVIRPVLNRASELGVGATVLECARATKEAVRSNTNLGIVLLLAPLCAAPIVEVSSVLDSLEHSDADAVYEAIRLAQPGGMGEVDAGDVADAPSIGLVEAMKLAADRDGVARQYANGFDDVIKVIAPALVKRYADGESLDHAIVWAHMDQMAREPDSLIRRKCGNDLAAESSRRARAVIDADWPNTLESVELYRELDEWLREDGHRRNPGTSADLVTAGLFVALRDGAIEWPALWSGSLQLAGE